MNPEAIRQSIAELDQSIKRLMLVREGLAAQLPRVETRKATRVLTRDELMGKRRNVPR